MTDHFDHLAKSLVALTPTQPRALFPGYPGGGLGGGGSKWRGGLSASGSVTYINHAEARRNARRAMRDSVQARAVVERAADSVADGGLRLEMSPLIEVLGITRERATVWARDVEARFHMWASSKRQHRSEQLNWYQSQGLWAFWRQRDNDQFVRLYYDENPQLQSPLQFEFIDPDQIRGDASVIYSYGGQYPYGPSTLTAGMQPVLSDGIVRDDRGREVAYKVYVLDKDGAYREITVPAKYADGRPSMLHGFKPEYAGQGRGFSPLDHAIQEFENITDFSAATIRKAINQSNIVGFIEPSKDEDAVNPLEGILTNQGAGPAATLFGSNPQAVDGVPVQVPEDTRPGVDACYRVPEATIDTPGSLFIANLTKGSKISFPANTAPGDSFDKFVDSFTDYIAASCKIPREVVLMKFGQNYSASRATLLLFWRIVCIERAEMATDYLNPVVEAWLSCEIGAGRIVAPGWSDPRMRAAWLNCSWIGSGPPDIDPAKSAKARRDNLEMGATNVERESRDLNGTSAAGNIATNNAAYSGYKPLPWNEPGNPPPGSAAPAPATPAKAAAWWEDAVRAIVQEELEDR